MNADAAAVRVRPAAMALPDAYEEAAWTGTRWRIRGRTFAHVLDVEEGSPPVYAAAAGDAVPCTVLMFRSAGDELLALRHGGPPFFAPPWRPDEVGMVLDDATDWTEVAELVTESYCRQAPKKLAAQVPRPPG